LKIAPKNDVRHVLNGMLLKKVGDKFWHIVATNGHTLIAGKLYSNTADQNYDEIIIPYDVLKANTKGEYVTLRKTEEGYIMGDIMFKPIDGKYPNYLKLMPTFKEKIEDVVYDPSYLHIMKEAMNLWMGYTSKDDKINTPTITIGDGGLGLLHYSTDSVIGLIMPLKTIRHEVPAYWLGSRDR
jgi:hypothetical protein